MTWEQRYHPLRDEWVVVAAHRQQRPWSGEQRLPAAATPARHDPTCYLCPGNLRVGGQRNPDYDAVFVFDNDHPCVGPDAPPFEPAPGGGFWVNQARRASGAARVVCYSPRHDLSLSRLELPAIVELFRVWQREYRELSELPEVEHVLIFENRGEVVGVSNPHPHCQIYATNFVFKTIEVELVACRRHFEATGRALLQDIVSAEREDGRRIIAENSGALGFVPYFARYAYETFVTPKQGYARLSEMPESELSALADVLRQVLIRYDNLWQLEFPYVMALHQAPTRGEHPGFQFHIELHPPLRQPQLLKYLAGPEIGGGSFIADTSPEQKAAELRAVPLVHYQER
jgi:UDPglucose--hexose-1-phosphate uridylyltransferase